MKQENAELNQLGLKTTAYFNAMVSVEYDIYQKAAQNGYFVTYENSSKPYQFAYIGTTIFEVSETDYTNPEAVKWYKSLLQDAINDGFHGWMYDYGKYNLSRA